MKQYSMHMLIGAFLVVLALPAFAQVPTNCAPHDQVVARLADRYGETRQSIGLANNNNVVETFASAKSGTWSIAVTLPNGLTCLIASGEAFERLDEPLVPAADDI